MKLVDYILLSVILILLIISFRYYFKRKTKCHCDDCKDCPYHDK